MNIRKLLTALSAAALLSPVLTAGEFVPANLFGALGYSGNTVMEVDRAGNTLREFGDAELDHPIDLAFGPSGHLYVASLSDRRIRVYDAAGVQVRDFGSGPDLPFHLAFGPDGHLFVAARSQYITEFTPEGNLVRSFSPPSGNTTSGLAIGADGLIYSGSFSDQKINVFTRSGDWIRSIALPESIQDFCLGPNGNLFLSLNNSRYVLEMRLDGSVAGSHGTQSEIGNIGRLAFGPDNNLYVMSLTHGKLFVFDQTGNEVDTLDDMWLTGFAFAPYRFKTSIKATVVRPGTGLVKVKEQRAVLSIHAGTGAAMLDLLDDPSNPLDLASLLSTTSLTFHGISPEFGHSKKRLLQGTQASPGSHSADSASLTLELKGKTDPNGVFAVRQAKGTLHARMGQTILSGTLKTTRLLKP